MRIGFIFAVVLGTGTICLAQSSECKPVERYGVKGCEIHSDRTCPAGYHQQAVNPPDRRMAGPTYLMCVPDKQQSPDTQSPKEEKPKQQKQEPPNSNT